VIVLASGAALALLGLPPVGQGPTVVVAVYGLGAHLERRSSLAWACGVGVVVIAHQMVTWWVDGVSFAGNLAVLGAAWWLGDAARRRREEAVAHATRAAELAAARDELARRAVADERLRMARELHDVVAHAMSAIAVQASSGRLAFDREPELARAALAAVETLSREALTDMRRLLGVLRPSAEAAPGPCSPNDEGAATLVPAVSLSGLDRLVASTAAAGVTVDVVVEGGPRPLPPGLDQAAYRIVQEALTNVVRHAQACRAVVTVCYGDEALVVEITDDGVGRVPHADGPLPAARDGLQSGPPAGQGRSGVGLVGMRERVAAYGGTLVAGPGPAGGFRVLARLPTPRPAGVT
jgi:signal transduction histidine kinase